MNRSNGFKFLPLVDTPKDLKKLSISDLQELANEIRQFLVDVISKTGGHLGSNLGSVELILALHTVYNAPIDQIIWDVGCQAYTHKIITGRKEVFSSNRQYGGISGFPKREESNYDVFGVGHASTSISAALGIASARDLLNQDFKVVAVIGDGGLSGGMAFEGLNNTGATGKDITVVFNDNNMAISPNVGALSNLFSSIRSDPRFQKIKDHMWELTGRLPQGQRLRKAMHGMDEGVRAMLMPGLWFERLGFRYVGPIDGHDLEELISIMKWAKNKKGPIVVHVRTTKGKGYSFAETDGTKLHGVSKFDPKIGPQKKDKSFDQLNCCEHFSYELEDLAENDKRICAITPAMIEGSALSKFQERFPNRCFDVGIAEEHALTFAAGLAVQGLKPVVAIYSSFLQRAFDQLIHDIALQNLPVVLGVDRAGLVGEDGPTHHGAFDLSYIRHIPNVTLFVPRDGQQLRIMLREALKQKKCPVAIRFPRGSAPKFTPHIETNEDVWQPELLRDGSAGLIVGVGTILSNCIKAAERLKEEANLNLAVLDLRCVKPLDLEYMKVMAKKYQKWAVVEENTIIGGVGSMLVEFTNDYDLNVKIRRIGLPDRFITHGDNANLWREVGFDVDSLTDSIREFFSGKRKQVRKKTDALKADA